MKTRCWVLILFAAAAAGILLSARLLTKNSENTTAAVYSGGELVCEINLRDRDMWGEFTVSCDNGFNVITVDENGIRIVSASCPDGLCVRQGYLRAAPIACLPNRLVIKWNNTRELRYDAIT